MHPTRNFILKTIEQFNNRSNLKLGEKSEDILSDFISNSHNITLQAYVINDDNLILLTQIQQIEDKSVIFYKNSNHESEGDGLAAISSINLITLSNNVAESLYHSLKQVYTPILTAENDVHSVKLQKHLSDLETVLKVLTYGKDDSNTSVILSIDDELEYWKTIGQKKDVSKKDKEAVSTFCELFHDIIEEIRLIQTSPPSEIREAAENIGGLLDDIWRFTTVPYSQNRMIHVFDIVGHIICSTLQKSLSSLDIWKLNKDSKEHETLSQLSAGLSAVQAWSGACTSLTETYWPNYALHSWNGKPYVPLLCLRFQNRLKEIHDIRSTYNQLNKLLTNNEKSELQTDTLFAPFQNINIWMYNGMNTSWETAVSKFSASLRPAEVKIAEKLKPRLHNTSTRQMLYEFMRYRSLLERPLVKRALNNELEIFVSSLLSMLHHIQSQLEADAAAGSMYQPPEMSPLVHQIQWAKQMEAKVMEVQTCTEMYLKEFERSSELLKVTNHLLKELKGMYTQLHEEWCRDLQARSKKGLLQVSRDTPVVKFNGHTKMMEVTYDGRLLAVELEARSLAALALPAPRAAPLAATADTAARARALHQVASFHNTLGERMTPSTRPMMLQAALELSALVQDHKAVYWDDTEQLTAYTDKLKAAVLKLEAQNTYLTSQHAAIRGVVEKLMDTELLAKQADWKKGVKNITDIIEKVEASGYKNTELWRSHWDWQLYKALECQYIKTLLSLHNHFPHVKVDLILRGHTVKVYPTLEELRVQHYRQLRRLVALPAHFQGVQDKLTDHSIFAAIVDKHSWLGNKAVNQLEAALSSLERTCKSWTRRAALACVADLEALCTEHLKEPADWELNFKACKAYGQAVAKMTFEDEKIDWITIGTTTLRREFEAQTRNLWAYLTSSLQVSCRNDATTIESFVANATVMLENKALPKNAKELSEISSKQQALQAMMPEMEATVNALKKKGYMLRTWGGDASVDETVREWQKIRELMLSQQQMFEHQAEIVKSGLKGEWANLNTAVEAFHSRWLQAKPRLEGTQGATYREVADRCCSVLDAQAHWTKLRAERDDLIKEYEKFNMNVELSNIWPDTDTLVDGYVSLWTTFKEYDEEFETIANQDWIVFQKKLHLIDEFTAKWKSRLEPYTVVTLFLQQELNKYTDLTSILKYVRGTEFTERHWGEVCGLLAIDYRKPDTLQVKDLLGAADNIKLHIKTLQKISASASSESAVRGALAELQLWFAGARLALLYHRDKAQRQTPIVTDFTDILNKIEEKQWVVSSLGAGAGADVAASWEPRLRSARRLVRATHHAQRR